MPIVLTNNHDRPALGANAAGATRPVRVTQICTTDLRGGAAKAAYRLHRALNGEVISRMVVAQRFGRDREVLEYNAAHPAPAVLGRALFRLGRRLQRPPEKKAGAYFSPEWTLIGGRLRFQIPPSDLVNLHWVADLLDYRTLPRLAERFPLVWTFHDMNVFTGGCHYAGNCDRFTDHCGACPQLRTSEGENDMTRRVFDRKRRIFARIPRGRLTIVTPSRWLAGEAARSPLAGGFDVRVIPSGLDLQEYRPMDRIEARRRLGLPLEARIVLFVADAINDHRKGLRFLVEGLANLRDIPGFLMVTLGECSNALLPGSPVRHLAPTWSDDEKLRAAYSAADVFAIPSLQDNFPNTVLESMACGTPVVGFAAGGIGEAIVDGETGFLASIGDGAALAAGLRRILEDPGLQRALGRGARARVEREYTCELQVSRYGALYQEILREQGARELRPAAS
jgi:glycosyltransferase involved in cell wall biosynthesis